MSPWVWVVVAFVVCFLASIVLGVVRERRKRAWDAYLEKKAKKESERAARDLLDKLTPPTHFNCRSTVRPAVPPRPIIPRKAKPIDPASLGIPSLQLPGMPSLPQVPQVPDFQLNFAAAMGMDADDVARAMERLIMGEIAGRKGSYITTLRAPVAAHPNVLWEAMAKAAPEHGQRVAYATILLAGAGEEPEDDVLEFEVYGGKIPAPSQEKQGPSCINGQHGGTYIPGATRPRKEEPNG